MKPRLHTDDNGYTDFDRYEREEAAYSRDQEDKYDDKKHSTMRSIGTNSIERFTQLRKDHPGWLWSTHLTRAGHVIYMLSNPACS